MHAVFLVAAAVRPDRARAPPRKGRRSWTFLIRRRAQGCTSWRPTHNALPVSHRRHPITSHLLLPLKIHWMQNVRGCVLHPTTVHGIAQIITQTARVGHASRAHDRGIMVGWWRWGCACLSACPMLQAADGYLLAGRHRARCVRRRCGRSESTRNRQCCKRESARARKSGVRNAAVRLFQEKMEGARA